MFEGSQDIGGRAQFPGARFCRRTECVLRHDFALPIPTQVQPSAGGNVYALRLPLDPTSKWGLRGLQTTSVDDEDTGIELERRRRSSLTPRGACVCSEVCIFLKEIGLFYVGSENKVQCSKHEEFVRTFQRVADSHCSRPATQKVQANEPALRRMSR